MLKIYFSVRIFKTVRFALVLALLYHLSLLAQILDFCHCWLKIVQNRVLRATFGSIDS